MPKSEENCWFEAPKCKVENYGLARKNTLINISQRLNARAYEIREEKKTIWLRNESEEIGLEQKHIQKLGIDIHNFLKPRFGLQKSQKEHIVSTSAHTQNREMPINNSAHGEQLSGSSTDGSEKSVEIRENVVINNSKNCELQKLLSNENFQLISCRELKNIINACKPNIPIILNKIAKNREASRNKRKLRNEQILRANNRPKPKIKTPPTKIVIKENGVKVHEEKLPNEEEDKPDIKENTIKPIKLDQIARLGERNVRNVRIVNRFRSTLLHAIREEAEDAEEEENFLLPMLENKPIGTSQNYTVEKNEFIKQKKKRESLMRGKNRSSKNILRNIDTIPEIEEWRTEEGNTTEEEERIKLLNDGDSMIKEEENKIQNIDKLIQEILPNIIKEKDYIYVDKKNNQMQEKYNQSAIDEQILEDTYVETEENLEDNETESIRKITDYQKDIYIKGRETSNKTVDTLHSSEPKDNIQDVEIKSTMEENNSNETDDQHSDDTITWEDESTGESQKSSSDESNSRNEKNKSGDKYSQTYLMSILNEDLDLSSDYSDTQVEENQEGEPSLGQGNPNVSLIRVLNLQDDYEEPLQSLAKSIGYAEDSIMRNIFIQLEAYMIESQKPEIICYITNNIVKQYNMWNAEGLREFIKLLKSRNMRICQKIKDKTPTLEEEQNSNKIEVQILQKLTIILQLALLRVKVVMFMKSRINPNNYNYLFKLANHLKIMISSENVDEKKICQYNNIVELINCIIEAHQALTFRNLRKLFKEIEICSHQNELFLKVAKNYKKSVKQVSVVIGLRKRIFIGTIPKTFHKQYMRYALNKQLVRSLCSKNCLERSFFNSQPIYHSISIMQIELPLPQEVSFSPFPVVVPRFEYDLTNQLRYFESSFNSRCNGFQDFLAWFYGILLIPLALMVFLNSPELLTVIDSLLARIKKFFEFYID